MTQKPPSASTTFLRWVRSGKTQLNLIGVGMVILIALSEWRILAAPFTVVSGLLALVLAYTGLRVIYELTWNRHRLPTLATGMAGRKKIASLISAHHTKISHTPYSVIDLGSGRGELAQRIARTIPSASVVGIEYARVPFWQSRLFQLILGPKNLSFLQTDFWQHDCTSANAIVMYLNQPLATQAGEKLAQELIPGSIVISYNFPLLGTWLPTETLEFRTPFKEVIYVYEHS